MSNSCSSISDIDLFHSMLEVVEKSSKMALCFSRLIGNFSVKH
ncbi:hypothetical protein HMPREF0580_1796 [Mobiluncus mulieris ATCC 35239]|uniref:Uncharacterized protein n=1 Tax=Mobiluncus mulieris ATCC 35239 TaxID=871571 RepID=E0QSD1_9ACTO|nr:hypothetical protein HMPREF0580_1796 [Mobiluncus mulieris ATCC 35239]